MRYVQPYGVPDSDASYINGDPTIGRAGSIPPAEAFEHPMREIIAVIDKNKFAPDAADLSQLLKSTRSQRANYVEDTGSVNSLSVACDPPLGAYTIGLPLRVRLANTCTGGTTIDAGAGRVPIKLMNGGSTGAGDLVKDGICELVYDGAAFQLINFFGLGGGAGGDETTFLIKIPYTVDASPTPNIVTANFVPAITTLTAGDPLLVKIANTCTGDSVIRVNGLADKKIRANGGGVNPLLQGDLQAGDVVLFLYDGTQFWIAPNPLISADMTINVPAAYSTPENALLAIRRKTIAQNATVTILMAQGVFAPFKINHANADRIVIRGTMKIAGVLTGNNFYQTGNSSAARASDSANNIAMLRTHFGTEVQVPATGGASSGIENVGPGAPTIADILITGPNYWSGDGVGRWMGVTVLNMRQIIPYNISCWGLDIGFWGGGIMTGAYACFSSGCFRNGAHATSGAAFSFNSSGFFGGAMNGFSCNQNSFFGCTATFASWNANVGGSVNDAAQITFLGSTAVGNGNVDLAAGVLSFLIVLNNGGFGSIQPPPGYMTASGGMTSVS